MTTHSHAALELEASALDALLQAEREVSERLAAADRTVAELNAAADLDVRRVQQEASIALTARLAQLTDEVHTTALTEAERQLALATTQADAFDALDNSAIGSLANRLLAEFVAPLRSTPESAA